jgi:hypothetical protein
MCSLYIARGGVRRLLGHSDQAAEDFRKAYELLDRGDKVCFCVCVSVCARVYTCANACRRWCVLGSQMADLLLYTISFYLVYWVALVCDNSFYV